MYIRLDEMTDEPVSVRVMDGNRVRIAYGRSTSLSLDISEAVDLMDAVATALAVIGGVTDLADIRQTEVGHDVSQVADADKLTSHVRDATKVSLHRDEDRVRAEAEVRESL